MKFCLLTMSGWAERQAVASFASFLSDPELIGVSEFSLTPEEITLLNPNTGTCPVFRTRRDADVTLGIYRRVPVLIREGDPHGNPWGITFTTMFHMSNDSKLFRTREQLEADGWTLNGNIFERGPEQMLPLYQGMMTELYTHRNADVIRSPTAKQRPQQPRHLGDRDLRDPFRVAQPLYWVHDSELPGQLPPWLLGFGDITAPTNERTLVPTSIPVAAVANAFPLLGSPELGIHKACLLANLGAFVVDYCVRQKFGRTSLNFFYVKQLPILPPTAYAGRAPWLMSADLRDWIIDRVLELCYTAWDMEQFADDLGDDGAPFRWDPERRILLRAELDAAFFQLYGVSREDADYILDTFPVVRRKDEERYGEYRTKRLILEIYDAMQKAMDTGVPYHTIADPPPGQGPRHPERSGIVT
jgi:hypothetical protein